jgi:hypothetical protein
MAVCSLLMLTLKEESSIENAPMAQNDYNILLERHG